jgi:predicted transcriptional regulator of viral defense system
LKLTDLIDEYMGRGKSTFTKEEALEDSGLSESAFYKASARLQDKSWLFQPRRGFFVIVRPEDRKMGAPPANEFIDYLMEYLDEPYYVGVLSAARIQGAAHQAPQVFQVVVRKTLQDIEKGRSPIRFIENKMMGEVPVEQKKVRSGYIRVSTPEATAVDVVYYRKHAAGLDNVANIIIELADKLDPVKLFEAAVRMHGMATVQRLGFILDKYGFKRLSNPLEAWVRSQEVLRVPLLASGERAGVHHDKRWHVLVNRELDPDIGRLHRDDS